MNDDEVDAEAAHQCQIVDDAGELRIVDRLAADLDDESAPAMRIDVRSRAAKPLHELRGVAGRDRIDHPGLLHTLRSRNSRSQELMT